MSIPKIPQWSMSKHVKISKHLSALIMIGDDGDMYVEWDPRPPRKPLKPKELERYRTARNELLRKAMDRRGITGDGIVIEAW